MMLIPLKHCILTLLKRASQSSPVVQFDPPSKHTVTCSFVTPQSQAMHTRDLYDSSPASSPVLSCLESGAMMTKALTAAA